VSLKQIRDPFKITQSGDGTKTRTLVFGWIWESMEL
jgi:hypothetical protein